MAVMKSKKGNDLVVDCNCECGNGIRISVDKDDVNADEFDMDCASKYYGHIPCKVEEC